MNNIVTIFRREFASYFDTWQIYAIIPVYLGLTGFFSLYLNDVLSAGVATMRTVFFWSATFFVLLIPVVTMRLFAEERNTGSIELLVTLPITEAEMVLGKFLAALSLMTIALGLTITYPITLASLGNLDLGPVLGGYLGLFLLGAAFTAIGTATSSLTRNQLVAFLMALVCCLVPFATGYALSRVPTELLPVVQYLSFEYHFNNLSRGVIDSRNIIYYLTVVAFFLHLAVFSLEHRRLR
jgi:ABC-2 type transport system permease protein